MICTRAKSIVLSVEVLKKEKDRAIYIYKASERIYKSSLTSENKDIMDLSFNVAFTSTILYNKIVETDITGWTTPIIYQCITDFNDARYDFEQVYDIYLEKINLIT